MFTKNVGRPMLASDIADRYFEKITYNEVFMRDYSFVATLRALVAPRIGDNVVHFNYKESSYTASDIRGVSDDKVISSVIGRRLYENRLAIFGLTARAEDNEAILAIFDRNFTSLNSGWTEMADVKAFVSANMDARFYINETSKSAYVIVSRPTLAKYHFLQALIPRYLPWFFRGTTRDELEGALIKSCTLKSSLEYERIIAEIAGRFDLRKVLIRSVIGGFEKSARSVQIRRVEEELSRTNRSIEENLDLFTRLCEKRDNQSIQLEGLRSILDKLDENSELVSYFECNKNLTPIEAEGGTIKFIARGYLDQFDPDQYECYARNFDSCYYTGYDVHNSDLRSLENRKLILDAIFSESPKLKVRTCGYYALNMNGSVNSSAGYHYPPEFSDCIPNPHLHNHNCLGNQQRYIKEALLKGDTMMAVTQCVASVSSINTGENATMRPFLRDLFGNEVRCIENDEGKVFNAVEALKWLKEQHGA